MIELIPAIDIIDGTLVRLQQGNYGAKTEYSHDPLEVAKKLEGVGMDQLRELGDQIKEKIGEGVVALASVVDGKVNLIVTATHGAMDKGAHAGNIIKAIAPIVGGGGGGRPNMAQAGGKNPEGIEEALEKVKTLL